MKNYIYTLLAGLLLLTSCSKELEIGDSPDFNVATKAATYKVNEEVVFNITGNADMISFYSGEVNNDYAFKDGRTVAFSDQGATMAFTSAVINGGQANQLAVLISSDFNGNYKSLEAVKSATWTDITSKFKLGTSATFLASTNQDISDLVKDGKPIYIAFKYLTQPQAVNGLAREWMVQAFTLTSKEAFNDAPLLITDQTEAAFRIIDQDSVNTPARSLITATRVTMEGNVYKDPSDPIYDPNDPMFDPKNPIYDPKSELYDPQAILPKYIPYDNNSPYNDPLRENWAVSRAIFTNKVNLGPDWSVPIRGIRNERLKEYKHSYSKPGTYNVYFVASNTNIQESKTIVKQLTIKIE